MSHVRDSPPTLIIFGCIPCAAIYTARRRFWHKSPVIGISDGVLYTFICTLDIFLSWWLHLSSVCLLQAELRVGENCKNVIQSIQALLMGSGLLPFLDAVTVTGPSLYIVHQMFWERLVQPQLTFKTQIPRSAGLRLLLPMKLHIFKKPYPSMVTIKGRGKDLLLNGLGDAFKDLWMPNLVHAQVIRAMYLLESNVGFNQWDPSLGVLISC
jgi:hypothetical protein